MGDQFLFSLITGIFIGGVAGYLGTLMLQKRMALVSDALGHLALPGMGLALLLGFDVSLGAFFFLALGILLIWFFEIKTSLPMEALVGVLFVTSLAIGFLIIPESELLHALIGDISKVSFEMTIFSVVLAIFLFFVIRNIYRGMVLTHISEDLARNEGIKIKRQNLIYLLSVAAMVALGIKIVGSLLVGALMIVPAATARNLSKTLRNYTFLASFFGIISVFFGALLFKITNFPLGPLIILVNSSLFIISIIFKK